MHNLGVKPPTISAKIRHGHKCHVKGHAKDASHRCLQDQIVTRRADLPDEDDDPLGAANNRLLAMIQGR